MRSIKVAKVAVLSCLALGAACSGKRGGDLPPGLLEPTSLRQMLKRAQSCEDLEAMLKADARQKMDERMDAAISSLRRWYSRRNTYGSSSGGDRMSSDASEAAPSAGGAGGAPEEDSSRASEYSETNTQVKGVDEADIVKTDGTYLYVLHGNRFAIVNAWPAPSLSEAGSTTIEGQPLEMYVADNRAVVYSTVDADPVLQAAGMPYRDEYTDGYYYGWHGGGMPMGSYGYYSRALTKLTVLALEGAKATVARELYFEGRYVSSRRVGSQVRTVLTGGAHGPKLRYWPDYTPGFAYPESLDGQVALYENLRKENHRAIDASTAATWLPYDFERRGTGVAASLKNCADLWVPPAGSTEHGLTQVTAIDLDAPDRPATGQAILGAVDTVYSSAKNMYLASRGWFSPRVWDLMQVLWDDTERPEALRRIPRDTPVTLNHTHLHKFDLASDPTTPLYAGSGTIAGSIEDQFSMDETADGVFRVSATEQRVLLNASPWREAFQPTANHLFVMRETPAGLKTVGSVRGLAPGESIFSTRFVGTRGYVVTFRQVDPLFVFDLTVPELPRLLGELKIPGFSDYMHPLDDGHLLTIGREVDEDTGRDQGLALQIFDVTNPTLPRQAHKHVYTGDGYGYSEANWNHKAFTFFAQRGLLAFPYHAWGQTSGATSSLEVFRVDAKEGFSKLGSANHSPFFSSYSRSCYFSPAVRRGVFLEDIVYSISYGGIVATDTRDMAKGPIASLSLSRPELAGYPACY